MHKQKGDLLAIDRGIIIHGCNCQGVMGSGVAEAVRRKYPTVYDAYIALHKRWGLKLGTSQFCVSPFDSEEDWAKQQSDATCAGLPQGVVVVNAMTQYRYGTDRRHVDYDAVSAVFARIALLARASRLPVYFPLIGCGLAGGDWEEVAPRIEAALGQNIDRTLIVR